MPHTFKIGQLVGLAQTFRDLESDEVVQLRGRPADMPETPSGEPQCRIKELSSGTAGRARGRDQAAPLSPGQLCLRKRTRTHNEAVGLWCMRGNALELA